MNWIVFPVLLLYFGIGWWLSDLCNGDAERMTVFITWPLIIVMIILVAIIMIFVGIVNFIMTLFCKEDGTNGSV